ncbi:NAD(P)/FAD-dependent oxidoreductase [Patescibacteria group bacterium]
MYDLIIIGGGPAGVTAAIYAARYKLNFLLISDSVGGWLNQIHKMENYPGYVSISGFDLIQKFNEQLKYLEVEIISEKAVEISRLENKNFEVKTHANQSFQSKTVIVAAGSHKRELGVSGEKEFLGKGVSYCAICDGAFFKNKKVAVVGGANSAVSAALMLSDIASEVYIIYRKEKLRAHKALVDKAEEADNIKILCCRNITKINGGSKVESIELDETYQDKNLLEVDGVFIEIGHIPTVDFLEKMGVELDEQGQINVDVHGKTNIEGIFGAGDVSNGQGNLKQVITAAASGALAATGVNEYLKNL